MLSAQKLALARLLTALQEATDCELLEEVGSHAAGDLDAVNAFRDAVAQLQREASQEELQEELRRKSYVWEHLVSFRGGSRYYRDLNTGRVAWADNSGSRPDLIDAGVLWLVTDKPVTLSDAGSRLCFSVPVRQQRTGREMSIWEGRRGARWLVQVLGMTLSLEHGLEPGSQAYRDACDTIDDVLHAS